VCQEPASTSGVSFLHAMNRHLSAGAARHGPRPIPEAGAALANEPGRVQVPHAREPLAAIAAEQRAGAAEVAGQGNDRHHVNERPAVDAVAQPDSIVPGAYLDRRPVTPLQGRARRLGAEIPAQLRHVEPQTLAQYGPGAVPPASTASQSPYSRVDSLFAVSREYLAPAVHEDERLLRTRYWLVNGEHLKLPETLEHGVSLRARCKINLARLFSRKLV
jgi:hypothetical protein